jgi:hypothetical protein
VVGSTLGLHDVDLYLVCVLLAGTSCSRSDLKPYCN